MLEKWVSEYNRQICCGILPRRPSDIVKISAELMGFFKGYSTIKSGLIQKIFQRVLNKAA